MFSSNLFYREDMAAINFEFLHDDEDGGRKEDDGDTNHGQGEDDDAGDQEMDGQDEFPMTPTQRLERYLHSENAFERQMVARTILDGLREILHDQEQSEVMLEQMSRLSTDQEPMVRAELMEQIPHIAMFCHMNSAALPRAVSERVLPILVNYLRDNNNQVRKTSQAALLVLLEQGLLDSSDINHQVCPALEELTAFESVDDFRTEAVALMTRMASFMAPDVTESFFLPRFASLCSDSLFHVRKVCAANIGDMCNVVGRGATEEYLLPKFFYLCEDGVWGVRKACAECYMTVSSACSQGKRQTDLAPMFVQLLCDQSRWVRMAAFQQLGPFISTFAEAEEKISENEDSSCLLSETAVDTPKSKSKEGGDDADKTTDKEKGEEEAAEKKESNALSSLFPSEAKLAQLHKLAAEVGDLIDDEDDDHHGARKGDNDDDYEVVDGLRVLRTMVVTNSALKGEEVDGEPLTSSPVEVDATLTKISANLCDLTPVPMEIEETTSSTVSIETVVATSSTITISSEPRLQSLEEISAEERRMRKQYCNKEAADPVVAQSEESSEGVSSTESTAASPTTVTTSATTSTTTTTVSVTAPTSVEALLTVSSIETTTRTDSATSTPGSSETTTTTSLTTSTPVSPAASAPAPLSFTESYDQFNYWYIPPPILEDPLLSTLVDEKPSSDSLQASSSCSSSTSIPVSSIPSSTTPSSSNVADASKESKASSDCEVGKVSKDMEALEIGGKTPEEQELEISQTFEIPPLAMSSPDREVDSRTQSANANQKEDADVEMAEDDPVTDLFGDDEDGEPPLLLVSGKDEDGLTSRRGGSIGSYLDPLVEFTEEERRFQEQQEQEEQQQQQQQQNVIPTDLLSYFLSMADPAKVQTVDTELTRHCAFSLPAVALTLGRKNWGCLRDIYETLASDMQWKVRYTLACSFHEMARIMGQEITSRDLLPIFDGFLKDLDEVRIGILKHLADFFELLMPNERKLYLLRVRDFMNCDNQRNWRFRLELANQLSPLASLFEPRDVAEHLLPIAFELAFDRVAKVRMSSFRAMCACAKTFEFGIPSADVGTSSPTSCASPSRSVPIPGNETLVKSFLNSLVNRLATSPKWLDRQAFTIVSGLLLAQEGITQRHFDEYLLLPLCQLQTDSVANVRLTLARALATHVLTKALFNSEENRSNCIYGQELHQTIEALKKDEDIDVQYCAHGGNKETECFDLRASSDDEGDQFMSAEYH